jgi:hypothetical protein
MKLRSYSITILLYILFAILLSVSAAPHGYAGGPLPGPNKGGPTLAGKGVDGELNAVALNSGDIVQYIVLFCKDTDFVLGPLVNIYTTNVNDLAATIEECTDEEDPTELCVEGFVLPNIFLTEPPGSPLFDCFPAGSETYNNLYITRVKNFVNTGISPDTATAISAEITMQAGHP